MSGFLSAILYYLIIKPISLLPFPLLYALSDFLFVVFYYLTPYRKKVVTDNLRKAFPEKSVDEIKIIRKKFYRHFCDIIVESLKLFSASAESIAKRIKLINPEVLEEFYQQRKSLVLVTGHYANWEWPAITLSMLSKYKGSGIYKKLSNQFFDKKLRSTRAAFGTELFTNKEVSEFMEERLDKLFLFGFINDQSPSNPKSGHWAMFLNQPTCMLFGAEKYAVKFNLPVICVAIRRAKRGYYTVEYTVITENPAAEEKYYITEKCSQINESLIVADPAYWLWTHRRWKHKPPEDFIVNTHLRK